MIQSELVFYRWYTRRAVYRGGRLLYYGEFRAPNQLLEVLGYTVREEAIPEAPLPVEFNRDVVQAWLPPELESELKSQLEGYTRRVRRERIESLRAELRELEVGDV